MNHLTEKDNLKFDNCRVTFLLSEINKKVKVLLLQQ